MLESLTLYLNGLGLIIGMVEFIYLLKMPLSIFTIICMLVVSVALVLLTYLLKYTSFLTE